MPSPFRLPLLLIVVTQTGCGGGTPVPPAPPAPTPGPAATAPARALDPAVAAELGSRLDALDQDLAAARRRAAPLRDEFLDQMLDRVDDAVAEARAGLAGGPVVTRGGETTADRLRRMVREIGLRLDKARARATDLESE